MLILLQATGSAETRALELDLNWALSVQANTSAIEKMRSLSATDGPSKKIIKQLGCSKAITCIDLTTYRVMTPKIESADCVKRQKFRFERTF